MQKKLFCYIFLSVVILSSHAQLRGFNTLQQRDSILQLKIGVPFPEFAITNINGDTFSEQELKGKITVINIWFKACAPCIAELDALNKLYLKFKDNPDFRFLSFTIDSRETAKEAIEKFGVLFDVCPTTKEECERLFCAGFPTNLIVDQHGKVAYIKSGGYPNDTHIRQIELLTAFLLKENNWKTPYSYSVSTSILPDSLVPPNVIHLEMRNIENIVGHKYMDFKATTLRGKHISHEQLQGKVTMIDIWHQYCAPCIAAFEFINELYLNYKDNPAFQLYTFTSDSEDDAEKVVSKYNLLYDVACIEREESYRLNHQGGFPTILIIDSCGIVSYYRLGGYIEKEKVAGEFKELEIKIDNLLKSALSEQ